MAELILDLDEADYHNDPCDTPSLSSSTASVLLNKSPAHAYAHHPKLGGLPTVPTKDMDVGSLIHAILLRREQQVCAIDADDFRTKAARELRDEARDEGRIPVLRRVYEEASLKAMALDKQIAAYGYDTTKGCNEVTILWQEDTIHGPVQCRSRLDHLNIDRALILDVKKARSAHPRACEKHVIEYGYDVQRAAYTRAVESKFPELLGRLQFTFLFCELDPVPTVVPAELDGVLRERGDRRWQEACETWAWCLSRDTWPSYADGIVTLHAPPWVLRSDEEAESAAE